MDAADPLHRAFEPVRGHLREDGFEPLAERRRAHEDRYAAGLIELEGCVLLARAAALDVAANAYAVIFAGNALAALLRDPHPSDLVEAAVERLRIVSAVACAAAVIGQHTRQRVRHLGGCHEILAPDFDGIDCR